MTTLAVRRVAYWLSAPLLCLALYWQGLMAWFSHDDFAWLGIGLMVERWRDLPHVLFSPMAQGTIRPFSERLFFWSFYEAFGLHAFPFRLMVFLTMFANFALLASLTRRITGSALAGWLAPLLWLANSCLVTVMTWTSAYNQALCAFCLLGALWLFSRYADTGRRGFAVAQWAVFLFGFGVLELNVVYPVLAAAYAFCFARQRLWHTLPLFAVSGLYTLFHRSIVRTETHFYKMVVDASMLDTLSIYWRWLLGPLKLAQVRELPSGAVLAVTLLLTSLLVAFSVRLLKRGERLPLFCWAWFGVVLGPVLPLRNHISEYYLTIPSIGVAILAAAACSRAWHRGAAWRLLAALPVLVYLACSLPPLRAEVASRYGVSQRVRTMVESVYFATRQHPGKLILLNNVDQTLFWAGIYDYPFRLFGARYVYLTPETRAKVPPSPYLDTSHWFPPASTVFHRLEESQAVVYDIAPEGLRNITSAYRRSLRRSPPIGLPRRVDLGQPHLSEHLGEGWYGADDGIRWMPRRAVVRLGGPASADQKLYVDGLCPEQLWSKGPVQLTVSLNGQPYPPVTVSEANADFRFAFPLPPEAVGAPSVDVALDIDRTFSTPTDDRNLGLAFGVVEIQ